MVRYTHLRLRLHRALTTDGKRNLIPFNALMALDTKLRDNFTRNDQTFDIKIGYSTAARGECFCVAKNYRTMAALKALLSATILH